MLLEEGKPFQKSECSSKGTVLIASVVGDCQELLMHEGCKEISQFVLPNKKLKQLRHTSLKSSSFGLLTLQMAGLAKGFFIFTFT